MTPPQNPPPIPISGGNSSNKRAKTTPTDRSTLRNGVSMQILDSGEQQQQRQQNAEKILREHAHALNQRAQEKAAFAESEIRGVWRSLQNVCCAEADNAAGVASNDDNDRQKKKKKNDREQLFAAVLRECAHVSHKDWHITEQNAAKLYSVLFFKTNNDNTTTSNFASTHQSMLERIFREGNWMGAAQHAAASKDPIPWAVLVTGVNGIRKTTSMYQTWFPQLLEEALQLPESNNRNAARLRQSELPCGSNSFFRQLDHMIATLCKEEFAALYSLTRDLLRDSSIRTIQPTPTTPEPTKEVIQLYSNLKAAIFTRYRTLSELLGVCLLREAQKLKSNCMLETSGRDVAMFHYVDHFFPATYRKLALHFTINDLSFAQHSVDCRMVDEIQAGIAAIDRADVRAIINANAGGPYGSEVLEGVQSDSDRVWRENVVTGQVGSDWYKASIQINAHARKPWTAQAIKPDGSLGTEFTFERTQLSSIE